jgi:hypothetical protein
MGKILLTLRRPDETDEEEGETVTPLADILRGGSKMGSDPPATNNSSKGSGFGDFLSNLGKSATGAAPSTSSGEPKWTMEILGPAERRRFEWLDEKGLPIESAVSGVDSTSTSSTAAGEALVDPKSEEPSSDDENKLPSDGPPKRTR